VAVQPKAKVEERELVTGISGTSLKTLEKKQKAAPLVIPRIENTFQVGVGKTATTSTATTKAQRAREQRFLPTVEDGLNSKTEDKFELAEEVPVDVNIGYGLTKFDARKATTMKGKGEGEGNGTALSQLMTSQQDKETQQMKEDLENLPEQATIEVLIHAYHLSCSASPSRPSLAISHKSTYEPDTPDMARHMKPCL
jgi:hypothetical protein